MGDAWPCVVVFVILTCSCAPSRHVKQFDGLIRRRMPGLYAHSEAVGVSPAMYSSTWFLALFSNFNSFEADTVKRIWDMFFLDGWPVRAKLCCGHAHGILTGAVFHTVGLRR